MSLWLVSYVALWLVAILLTFSTVVLFRQLGLLHLRFGPRGALALDEGPPIGTPVPEFVETDTRGKTHRVGGPGNADTTLVFVSPECGVCEDLIPAIRAADRGSPRGSRLIVVSAADNSQSSRFAERVGGIPVVASREVADLYRVYSPPFAVRLNSGGTTVFKGVINTLEQLEGVIDARLDVASNVSLAGAVHDSD